TSRRSNAISSNRITGPPTTPRCSTRRPRRRLPEATAMPTRLKETDVVVIGLGMAGGVAVLPLAQAGIEVIGLEAGSWLTRRDFAPDELRNNFRGWPLAGHETDGEAPTVRATAAAPTA